MRARRLLAAAAVLATMGAASVAMAQSDVFDMGYLTSLETVRVGNPGNPSDSTGYGSVAYEYNIGKYEVTAAQYTVFLNAVARTDTYGLYNSMTGYYACKILRQGLPGYYTYTVAPERADRPVNTVSWPDAARFANWLHNGQPTGPQGPGTTEDGAYTLNGATTDAELMFVRRNADWQWAIPTEDEWYKAAYHKNDGVTGHYFGFPTGSDDIPSNQLIDPDPGNNANFRYLGEYTVGYPFWSTEVGEFENSASPYGTFDQGGNQSEWNEALSGSDRGYRGGSLHGGVDMHASYRFFRSPGYEGAVGFRVVQVPEPATLALLALGGLAMLRRR